MQQRATVIAVLVLALLGVLGFLLWGNDPVGLQPGSGTGSGHGSGTGLKGEPGKEATGGVEAGKGERLVVADPRSDTGVRGVVVDARSGAALGGVEVIAMRRMPSFERLESRFRGLFQGGMFEESNQPAEVLGSAISNSDGSFEIRGLPEGRVFLDGRSDGWFVRTPGTARLARGEFTTGVELRAQPGGRVRGVVLGADGGPAAGALVSLRPGLNAFLTQITERQYRWLETRTDAQGRFDLPGVPPGTGYAISAASREMALEDVHGLEVLQHQTTEVMIRGHQGAIVAGRALDGEGKPVTGANVAMVYLDVSRVLFSADGRTEPITTDGDGRFRIERVSAGRVAFLAASDGLAPSNIEERAVVDGGVYDDLELRLGDGVTVTGLVIDDAGQPLASAKVELRPFERPNDPDFLKLMLKIRRVEVQSGPDGRFTAKGMAGEQMVITGSKPGYTTAVRFGVKLDEKDLKVQLLRGAVVHGKVLAPDGKPITRFRVEATSRPVRPAEANGKGGKGEAAAADSGDADEERPRSGFQMRIGGGREGRGGPGRTGTMQMAEGSRMGDRGIDGNWQEVMDAAGAFEVRGVPPGRIRVRVRADGHLDPESQEVELAGGATSQELTFTLQEGEHARGIVVDAASGRPVGDAQVSAHKQREGRRGGLNFNIDAEDFDFLGMASMDGRRSSMTDSQGRFEIKSLEPGQWRFTARHPDLAKASAKDVEITAGKPVVDIKIELDSGGTIEGLLTGMSMRPLPDAMVVAVSVQAGAMKSSTTDRTGTYRIDGLPPGQYIVFKSRMDERTDNIMLDLMNNMRLKTATVRQGKVTRLDIKDESEDGVRVHGVVREGGVAVPRALVTLLGTDREGIFGMGVRAGAAGQDGRYQLIGIKPGSYLFQVSRFQGRPMQTTIAVDVPQGVVDFKYDIELPTSDVSGQVLDSRGQPVANMQVSLGAMDGSLQESDGLLGLIAQNGFNQSRTDAEGNFKLRSVAEGNYRLTASNRMGGGGRRGGGGDAQSRNQYGEAMLDHVQVDGRSPVAGLVITVPLAGRITGIVVDGSNQPVVGAEIHYTNRDAKNRRQKKNPLTDLLGMQQRPVVTGADGRFECIGLTPGTYDLRADANALETGQQSDVLVAEDAATEVKLCIVRGATLKLRATNVDRSTIPLGDITLVDSKGKAVVNKVSTLTVMRRLMGANDKIEDSGWYEFGSVPPDTYTAVLRQPGREDIRITRAITDGETVAWDIDVTAELQAAGRSEKK